MCWMVISFCVSSGIRKLVCYSPAKMIKIGNRRFYSGYIYSFSESSMDLC
jgi:hypothetical protein